MSVRIVSQVQTEEMGCLGNLNGLMLRDKVRNCKIS